MKKTRPEAHVMKDLAKTHEVPEEHIIMEEKACNTPENMIFTKRVSFYIYFPSFALSPFLLFFLPSPIWVMKDRAKSTEFLMNILIWNKKRAILKN
jgi:hypothetical protein